MFICFTVQIPRVTYIKCICWVTAAVSMLECAFRSLLLYIKKMYKEDITVWFRSSLFSEQKSYALNLKRGIDPPVFQILAVWIWNVCRTCVFVTEMCSFPKGQALHEGCLNYKRYAFQLLNFNTKVTLG